MGGGETQGPGRRARLSDVARAAGVSTATASYVMSGRRGQASPAAEETIQRIREAADALGYVPNRHAQAIRRGYSNSIVLALGMPEDPWSTQVAVAVQKRASILGFSTLALIDETWYEFLLGSAPGAAFITSADFEPGGLAQVDRLADLGTNLVVFSTIAEPTRFDVISSSPVEATLDAYARLRARHPEVHMLSARPPEMPQQGATRLAGFRAAVASLGDRDPERLIQYAGTTRQEASRACDQLLEGIPLPAAVICSTGHLAEILRGAALRRGLRIPEDLEIIAIGDIPDDGVSHLGPVSHYGVPGVFDRIGDIVVGRAQRKNSPPFTRHEFVWSYQPGDTTIEDHPAPGRG